MCLLKGKYKNKVKETREMSPNLHHWLWNRIRHFVPLASECVSNFADVEVLALTFLDA